MAKQVYIVAHAGIDTFSIKHVCLSEETARAKFAEMTKDDLKEERDYLERVSQPNYFSDWGNLPEADVDFHRKYTIESIMENIKALEENVYPGAGQIPFDLPVVEVYDLLD